MSLRADLESWLVELPDDRHKQDVEARLRSYQGADHFSALQELALHHEFLGRGYRAEPHPAIPDTRSRPDFLVATPAGSMVVEAVIASDARVRQERDHRLRHLLDDLESIHGELHLIAQLQGDMPRNFPTRRVRAFLEREIAAGWPDEETRTFSDPSGAEIEFWAIRDEEWVDCGVAGYGLGVESVDTPSRIRLALTEKASKYGKPYGPFVISLMVCTSFRGIRTELAALYGSVNWTINWTTRDVQRGRNSDGFFMDVSNGRLRNTQVSAVLVLDEVRPWDGPIEHVFRVFHNPYAACPLPEGVFSGWPQMVPRENNLVWVDPPGPPAED